MHLKKKNPKNKICLWFVSFKLRQPLPELPNYITFTKYQKVPETNNKRAWSFTMRKVNAFKILTLIKQYNDTALALVIHNKWQRIWCIQLT